jgi:transposase
MTFVGFDLHKRYITACALDASGVVVAEIRQLTTTLATVLATVLEWLAALPAPITIAMEAALYWEWLVARLDDQVRRAARCDPAAQRLATIPGVGVFGALFLHAEIGPIERIRSSHQLAAYAGLFPTTRSSGGKTTHGPLAKMSDHWLEWILVEIVQTLKLAPGPVGAYYRHRFVRKASRRRRARPRGSTTKESRRRSG